jgi:hypothetical protein
MVTALVLVETGRGVALGTNSCGGWLVPVSTGVLSSSSG